MVIRIDLNVIEFRGCTETSDFIVNEPLTPARRSETSPLCSRGEGVL
jgi:hypothetical protein